MNPQLLNRLVNYFLNTYNKVDNPIAALVDTLDGDMLLADRLLAAWRKLAAKDWARFLRVNMPEPGDSAMRQWITEIYLAN
jgi:hypothetical protein